MHCHHGRRRAPSSVMVISDGAPVDLENVGAVLVLVLRKPDMSALVHWDIRIV